MTSPSRAERLLLPATFITNLGNSIQLTAASIVMLQSEHSTLAVGWLFVAFAVPATLLSLVFGPLVDRFDRRRLCMLCDVASAIVAAALPLWLVLGRPPNVGIYIATFSLAAVGAMFMPASNALIKERVADQRLGPFNANFEIASQAGTLLSTAIGGVLVQLYGATPLFVFNAVTFLASLTCFALMGRRVGHGTAQRAPLAASAEPVRAPLARLGLLYALGQPVVVVVNTLIVVLLLQTFAQKAGVLGIADSLAGVGAIAAATVYKWVSRRLPNLRIALLSFIACGLTLALEPRFGVLTFMLLYPLGAMMFSLGRVSARTMLLHAVPESQAGRVFGIVNAFGLALGVAATIGISRLVDRSDVQTGWLVLGLLLMLTSSGAVALLWKTHGQPSLDPVLDPPAVAPAAP